ncbi:hypothetical protein SAMN02745146_1971 [Hymenobacter daecheongensis DSM 21074]|uniref:Uncharacterized protein n=1 Tax=Hymenobacter daecheongensis DSM 21074 TaxID=1121955 RepID=A0A1M6F8E7_9BACT|nr:hypothetical protein [Hymenobacter daecheongensis]SHI93926.1 hypothetical protein SAMN02745146_1971 [Hymenobacter daecheongensis DSM 21074]
MKHALLAAGLFLGITACRSEQETANGGAAERIPAAVQGEVSTTEAVGENGRSHAYLRRLSQQQGRSYATVDYIQFLNGPAAVTAARRRGDALAEVVKGDTVYSVFNDYYIINDSPRRRTLPLSGGAVIRLWRMGGELSQYVATPAQLLAKGPDFLRATPFIVETKDGVIISLTQQFIP